MSAVLDADLIDVLSDLTTDSPVARLRREREEVRRATQGSFDALFEAVRDAGALAPALRERAAQRVAFLQSDAALAAWHRERALRYGTEQPMPPAVLAFVDRLTLNPAAARPAHMDELRSAGFAPREIVTLAQLIGFVSYQVRVLAGLRALAALGSRRVAPVADAAALRAGTNTLAATPPSKGRFTLDVLEWAAWLPTVDAQTATPEQLAVLEESHAAARTSPYYLTLVHEPGVLRQRSKLFNAIMYGPGGLPRAERELATVAVSRINGCPYCASVHGRLFAQLTKEPQVIEAIYADGVDTPLAARRRAIVDLGVASSANPPAITPEVLAELRAAGLADAEILDAIHAAAIFAWANRLMQTLGEPVAAAYPNSKS